MEKQLTTFEISKVLKKLGFEEECFGFYTNGEFTFEKNWVYDRLTSRDVVLTLRPTWSQVIDYIREKHNIHIVIDKVCNIDLSKSFMVGDRWRDVEAGASAGCKTFFINYRYAEQKPDAPDFIVSSLLEAKKIILGEF